MSHTSASRAETGISLVYVAMVVASVGGFVWLAHDAVPPVWLVFATVSIGYLAAVCLHEFGHARVAYAGGDNLARERGYLTLNPLRYLHPAWSIGIPLLAVALGGVGLPGAAVYIHTSRLRSRLWISAMALAGPLMSLAVMVLVGLVFLIWDDTNFQPGFWAALAFLAFLQATAFILNLLPVPGLDGFGAISPWLPKKIAMGLRRASPILIGLLLFAMIMDPRALRDLIEFAAKLTDQFSIDRAWIGDGLAAYRFWKP